MTNNNKDDKLYIPWDEGDELLTRAKNAALAYEKGRDQENAGKRQKEGAKTTLDECVNVIGITQQIVIGNIDGLILSEPDEQGKVLRYRRVKQKRPGISPQKLLELGVSAEIIKEATTETEVESWSVDRVRAPEQNIVQVIG